MNYSKIKKRKLLRKTAQNSVSYVLHRQEMAIAESVIPRPIPKAELRKQLEHAMLQYRSTQVGAD